MKRTLPFFLILGLLFATAWPSHAQFSRGAQNPAQAKYEIRMLKLLIDQLYATQILGELGGHVTIHETFRTDSWDVGTNAANQVGFLVSELQDLYGVPYEPTLRGSSKALVRRFNRLAPEKGEAPYFLTMIRHHVRTINLARQLEERAETLSIRRFATELAELSEQQAEVLRLRLCEWYPICLRPRPAFRDSFQE